MTLSSEADGSALSSEADGSALSSEADGSATVEQPGPERRLAAGDSLFYAVWGSANLVAYALVFLRFGASGSPGRLVRTWQPALVWWAFGLLLLMASLATLAHLLRSRAHAGPALGTRRLYAGAWLLTFVLAVPLLGLVHRLTSPAEAGLVTLSIVAHLSGVVNLFGGAVWRDGLQFAYGAAISLSIPLAVSVGPDGYALVYAMVVGVGGLLAALVTIGMRRRRDGT